MKNIISAIAVDPNAAFFQEIINEVFRETDSEEETSHFYKIAKDISLRPLVDRQDILRFAIYQAVKEISQKICLHVGRNSLKVRPPNFSISRSDIKMLRDTTDFSEKIRVVGLVESFVSTTKEFKIPTFVYTQKGLDIQLIEWKCGWCGRINVVKEQTCRGCGHSRTKTIQEYAHECSTTFVP